MVGVGSGSGTIPAVAEPAEGGGRPQRAALYNRTRGAAQMTRALTRD